MRRFVVAVFATAAGVTPVARATVHHEPPDARFRTAAGAQMIEAGDYCWPDRRSDFRIEVCTDEMGPTPQSPLISRWLPFCTLRAHGDYSSWPK